MLSAGSNYEKAAPTVIIASLCDELMHQSEFCSLSSRAKQQQDIKTNKSRFKLVGHTSTNIFYSFCG